MVVAPFRSPLRVRVERKQDLASIIGKLYRGRRESRNQDETAIGRGGSISRSEGEKAQQEVIGIERKSSVPKWADADWLESRAARMSRHPGRNGVVMHYLSTTPGRWSVTHRLDECAAPGNIQMYRRHLMAFFLVAPPPPSHPTAE